MTGSDLSEGPVSEGPVPEAAEYVLRLLSPEEHRAFEARLAEEAGLRDEVGFWEAQLATLAESLPGIDPRPELARRIAGGIGGEPANQPEAPDPARWRAQAAGAARWRTVSALAACVILALGFQLWQVSRPATPGPVLISAVSGGDLMIHVAYDPSRSGMRVTRVSGGAAPQQVLELWAIPPGGAPVSLGVLPESGPALLTLPPALAGSFAEAMLAVSLEPPGGSPTGAPTGPVVATGSITEF